MGEYSDEWLHLLGDVRNSESCSNGGHVVQMPINLSEEMRDAGIEHAGEVYFKWENWCKARTRTLEDMESAGLVVMDSLMLDIGNGGRASGSRWRLTELGRSVMAEYREEINILSKQGWPLPPNLQEG